MRKKNVNGNEFVLSTCDLHLHGSIDRNRTAAVSMSILIQCPSLIAEIAQTPSTPVVLPLPPSVKLYSAKVTPPSCDIQKEEKVESADSVSGIFFKKGTLFLN